MADNTYKTRDEKRIIRYSRTVNVFHIQLQVVFEQVTACLEGRWSQDHRLLDINSPFCHVTSIQGTYIDFPIGQKPIRCCGRLLAEVRTELVFLLFGQVGLNDLKLLTLDRLSHLVYHCPARQQEQG